MLFEKIAKRYYPIDRGSSPFLSVLIHYELGQVYETAGRYDEAIKQYETFLHIWRDADDGIKMVDDAKERLAILKSKS